jgi:coenzyme F420-reducing hydrogenase delta subunit
VLDQCCAALLPVDRRMTAVATLAAAWGSSLSNQALKGLEPSSGETMTPFAGVIPVRCLGSVSLSWITDSLNSGYDGVVLMGFRRDDDYQCHFVRGSALDVGNSQGYAGR